METIIKALQNAIYVNAAALEAQYNSLTSEEDEELSKSLNANFLIVRKAFYGMSPKKYTMLFNMQ